MFDQISKGIVTVFCSLFLWGCFFYFSVQLVIAIDGLISVSVCLPCEIIICIVTITGNGSIFICLLCNVVISIILELFHCSKRIFLFCNAVFLIIGIGIDCFFGLAHGQWISCLIIGKRCLVSLCICHFRDIIHTVISKSSCTSISFRNR